MRAYSNFTHNMYYLQLVYQTYSRTPILRMCWVTGKMLPTLYRSTMTDAFILINVKTIKSRVYENTLFVAHIAL